MNSKDNLKSRAATLSIFQLYGGQALWFPVLSLICFGVLFVYSASSVYSAQKYGDEFIFVKKQLLYLIPGIIAAICGAKISLRFWFKYRIPIFFASVFLATLTRVPGLGRKVKGAARWISIGPVQFQPSESLKIATIFMLAGTLHLYPKSFQKLWPLACAFACLIIQPDFGSCVILFLTVATMLFMHGLPLSIFSFGIASLLPIVAIVAISAPYRVKRLVSFLDPFADALGAGFQIIQSFVAIANGGWFGRGLGGSQQKLFFLPEAHTDFILAVIGEEMGFAGIFTIMLIYSLFFYAIIQIVSQALSSKDRLIASGIFAIFAGSTIINLGMVAGLLPTKGLPLPFISSGGSSLVVNLFMVGILSQIHKNTLLQADSDSSKQSQNRSLISSLESLKATHS